MPKKGIFTQREVSQDVTFALHKAEYQDKIIDYPDSPTGRAYVGINKTPFMPAANKGHGFQGILLQDENRELIQCHSCGSWQKKITAKHLAACGGLTPGLYKTVYGLNKNQGLVSDETSLVLTKACLKNKEHIRVKFGRKYGDKGYVPKNGTKHNMQFFNRYGTCPVQLKARLYEFIRCNRELPSPNNRGRPLYKALYKRYGSFGHALSAHGLPWMKRQGTNMRYVFPDGTVYKYNMNQFYDREALFALMMAKCPVLSQHS